MFSMIHRLVNCRRRSRDKNHQGSACWCIWRATESSTHWKAGGQGAAASADGT